MSHDGDWESKEAYTLVERILRATCEANKLRSMIKCKAGTHGVDGDVHHDDTKESASFISIMTRLEPGRTDWNAGAVDAIDTMEKPEARTAKD